MVEILTPEGKRILIKPTTYMNKSGEAVASARAWQKPDKLVVVYDDVDLPFGSIRVREKGGSAGHNGIKSIMERLGTDAFTRVRIGIGRPSNPRVPIEDWVLKKWSKSEEEQLPEILEKAVDIINSKF